MPGKINPWKKERAGSVAAASYRDLVGFTHVYVSQRSPLSSAFKMGPPYCVYMVCDEELRTVAVKQTVKGSHAHLK